MGYDVGETKPVGYAEWLGSSVGIEVGHKVGTKVGADMTCAYICLYCNAIMQSYVVSAAG